MAHHPADTYDAIANDYLREFSTPSDHIEDFVRLLPAAAHVLDIGCGPGVDAAYLSSKDFCIRAFDASPNMVKLAQAYAPLAHISVCDMQHFDYGHQVYDGIIASYSLIHVTKQEVPSLFRKMERALKPQGVLFLGLQMGESQEMEIDEPLNPTLKLFLNIFSHADVMSLLKHYNFHVIKENTRHFQTPEELNFTKYCVLAQKP